jgi:hypothetical protein
MSSQPHHSVRATLHRLLAAGSATLVFALGLMAVSPALHAWAHSQPCESSSGHDTTPPPYTADHDCAVVGFSHGLTLTVATVLPATVPTSWHEVVFAHESESGFAPARYARPPGRAPPLV